MRIAHTLYNQTTTIVGKISTVFGMVFDIGISLSVTGHLIAKEWGWT